jgi:hypothetical protein
MHDMDDPSGVEKFASAGEGRSPSQRSINPVLAYRGVPYTLAEGWAMVPTIIEDEQHAGGAECIRFHVYPSTTRPGVILASWRHAGEPVGPKGPAPIADSQLGTPVEIEFVRAVTVAHQDGVLFVWVDDPNGLFPPSARPSFSCAP